MRLLPRQARIDGKVRIDGEDVLAMAARQLRELRGDLVAMILKSR
jgi:ABC-type microcin C transport system duplicated ATPase subunit YejF